MARLSYVVTIIGIALMCVLAEELYTAQFDNIEPASILQNDSLREQYYKCFMDTGPCVTEDAKYFRGIFAEMLKTQCKKCTDAQKGNMDLMKDWYTKNKPEQWEALMAKYSR